MSSFFLKIVNMSIAASWLILAVVLLRVVLKKAPKWINVLLWGIVAFRLICPFSFESALSLIPSAETISPEIMMDWTPEISTGVSSIDKVVNPIITDTFAPEPIASANPLQLLIPVLAIVWAIGIIAMLVYAAVSYFRLQKKVGASLSVRDNIWICDDIQTPFILGFFKPSIYIPSGTDEAQLPYIIAHENAHLKRCDHWWKPLGYLVLAIHWFNPLVWIAYILLCRDIELACDEKVIRGLNQNESISYSEALLSCSVNRRTVMVCPLAFGEVGVKERVKNVLNYKKPAFWIVAIAVVSSIVLGVCFLTNPSSFPVKLDSVQISKASTMDFRTNSGQTTFQLSAAEIDELSSRIKHLKIGQKDQSLQGHTPFYSLYVDTRENDRITFSGFDSNGNQSAILYENVYYRITDSDFISYLQRICAGKTRTEAIDETNVDTAIHNAIMEHNKDRYYKGVFACESHTVLATEAGRSANSEEIETLTIYALTLYEEYNLSEEGIESVSGGCVPVALTFNVAENGYELSEYWEPGDGSQYSDDIRKKFPEDILDEVWNPQDYVDAMTAENKQKALEFSAQKGELFDYP
ncbi:M56 family metallopeptidase [Agathobacter rectalis]|uniref:M56 family metallopeptidase n=1 Tax=Agathobacter rectalis TaxID=39491 RepID=UPI0011074D15|nr:M56 family metallopeptidase [Agathobacter rectalis]